ncbi:MAG: pyruvate, phosphate dikinase [Elusimicrobia bacterium]|nr:pyruvate, phosphate dikinase [Elusimicrobiota bacterium]
MVKVYTLMSTGLTELDEVIQGVRPGDNIVWQVDSVKDYMFFVQPFCRDAYKKGSNLVYFRFAQHEPLIPEDVKADVYQLHPEEGFETFIAEIFTVIEKYGPETFYVFDCLSELTVDWYSDRMLANFFMLTCPYLYDYDTATYFALLRNRHTTGTIDAIHSTAQVVIDLYRDKEQIYMQPLKVYKRHTKTMYMLHHWRDNRFQPVKKSTVISEILQKVPHPWLDFSVSHKDMWNRVFEQAQEIQKEMESGGARADRKYEEYRQRLLKMVVTREEIVLKLAEKYFDLSDLIDIGKHMVGTGLIGGKTVGMLLARAILRKKNKYWEERLEPHDSFFIGSDVFYTYLIKSKCWWVRWKQRHGENFLEGAEEARNRMLNGTFPDDIQNQFKEILNYFGQSPIIVRSSSLLEDAYGNSFSGKYESVFCANQGTPEERLDDFLNAVRKVYSSTMGHDALMYRYRRGLLDRDEQMALLVQRVSGSVYDSYFYPQIAGVGFSYNLYVWNKDIDPKAGVLRVVFGLGTRAVDRQDDDYTRVVAVNEPDRRPEANFDEVRKYAQRKVDVLDLEKNRPASEYFGDLIDKKPELPLELFLSRDREMERKLNERPGKKREAWLITFDDLFSKTKFIGDLQEILRTLQDAYSYPVDIEFTANFSSADDFKINLLQCRPYQVKKGIGVVREPGKISREKLILETRGPVIGSSIHSVIDRLIYVVPQKYSRLSERDRYQVANLIGRITNIEKAEKEKFIMLLGPGRWGTSTPSLGVPVKFSEINNVSVICEIAEMHEGLVPDVSLGTHFFNDLVELDILYMAIYPDKKENFINREFLTGSENQLKKLIPDAGRWAETVRVIELSKSEKGSKLFLNVNSVEQRGICYRDMS